MCIRNFFEESDAIQSENDLTSLSLYQFKLQIEVQLCARSIHLSM